MGKKKREHVVFDQMLTTKKNIPFHCSIVIGERKSRHYVKKGKNE